MRKDKKKKRRGRKLDTVGVVGSIPIAPTTKKARRSRFHKEISALWLSILYLQILENLAKTTTKRRNHCGKIAVVRAA